MNTSINNAAVKQAIKAIQIAAKAGSSKKVEVAGLERLIPYPYPSPADWRDIWIYFLMLDRFNNPSKAPESLTASVPCNWNQRFDYRQGGNFVGITAQLDYLVSLGAKAIWLSPVLKNAQPPSWQYNYHGYAIQDFLTLDGRFASDGTAATADLELTQLIEAAHGRGLYVILDIVINHTARVFDYELNGSITDDFTDPAIMNAPLGNEPPIEWMNGLGFVRQDWFNTLPDSSTLSQDDAIWPSDLQREDFFRRRGNRLSDSVIPGSFVKGDFDIMRQLVMEYDAADPALQALRDQYGQFPVLNVLIQAYWYLIAKFDIDGFRIDTVKYVDPDKVEQFGNSMREFALSIGKRNFFTFGEVYDSEQTIDHFIGRNSTDGFGIDAALDYPLFFVLPGFAKCTTSVETLRQVFLNRKTAEQDLLSSHGEAGKYFVSFLDNHDQNQRFNHPFTPAEQILSGLVLLFCLQGIPCLYYGTEQGLLGTIDGQGNPDLSCPESVREALWGKTPQAFDQTQFFYQHIQVLGQLRSSEPALRYGRLYFRELSGNGQDFGLSYGVASVLAFSRILAGREILVLYNSNTTQPYIGFVLLDLDTNRALPNMQVAYSNIGTTGHGTVRLIENANFYDGDQLTGSGLVAALFVTLAPMETQVIVPE
jgi:glycosidase